MKTYRILHIPTNEYIGLFLGVPNLCSIIKKCIDKNMHYYWNMDSFNCFYNLITFNGKNEVLLCDNIKDANSVIDIFSKNDIYYIRNNNNEKIYLKLFYDRSEFEIIESDIV